MDFIDSIKLFSARVAKLKDQIQTEEATKTSLIMPFFQQVFGYDVFNPDEFVPEFTADVGIKKGEKVDYAICLEGEPCILIEAKWCGAPLDKHDSQLFRYFGTTKAKFAILTNGIVYKFYTDLQEENKMDLTPFMVLDLLNIKESLISELKRFCKSQFNIDEIFSCASELKYSNEIKKYFSGQLKEPSDDFVKFILSNTYEGVKTQNVLDKFKPIVKNALNSFISEMMNDRITNALKTEQVDVAEESETEEVAIEADVEKPKIITTGTELEAFYIIKAILSEKFDANNITYKDTVNYFGVLYNNITTKWICRLKLDAKKNYLILPDENKKEIKHEITTVNDIFKFKQNLCDIVERYV